MDVLLSEWRRMSVGGRVARVGSWVVYGVVTVMALRDVHGRDAEGVRGKKGWWTAALMPIIGVKGFPLPVVEVVYFLVGRKGMGSL